MIRIVTLAALTVFAGCAPEIVEEAFEPTASHADYADALRRLELDDTALGESWLAAGAAALDDPVRIETPFEEVAVFDPAQPSALGYQFEAERGRAVTIVVETELRTYFADLFRIEPNGPVLIASSSRGELNEAESAMLDEAIFGDGEGASEATDPADASPGLIRFEPRRDGRYLVRVQPELLRGGRVRIRIVATASLAFPVEGADPGDIWSFYGDGRDGGIRMHEGIDIFAARGTPLLAASDSVVARVGIRDRGGNIVTLYDEERDLMLYYAHLEEQLVTQGQRVRAGEPIGLMGNTGNAITTPPHLHIGLYQGSWRFDVDPWNYFVDPPLTEPPAVRHESIVGGWFRVAAEAPIERTVRAPVVAARWVNRNPLLRRQGAGDAPDRGRTDGAERRTSPAVTGADGGPVEPRGTRVPAALVPGDAVVVIGASGDRLRVRSLDKAEGFIARALLTEPAESLVVGAGAYLADPWSGDLVARLNENEEATVVGRRGDDLVVEVDGRVGMLVRG